MLKRFRVNNFRSLLNVEFRPVGVNVLIGPNNAGKTNLCAALRFLSLAASQPLEDAIRASVGETWNIRNVYVPPGPTEIELECSLPHDGDTVNFDYRLELSVRVESPMRGSALRVRKEILTATGAGFSQTVLMRNEDGEVWLLDQELPRREEVKESDRRRGLDIPTERSMFCGLHYREGNRAASLFKTYIENWRYYSLNPPSLRSPRVEREMAGIGFDGGNMTQTFFRLHNERPREEKKLIEIIRTLEPRLDLFTYTSPDPEAVYLFMEDQKRNRFSAQSISDGTLRFMAMAYLVLSGEESATDSPPKLVIIEEPENGLYVGHLKPLFERLVAPGRKDQFIFTTHSPYFIDLFDSCLEGVHVMKPGVPSSEIKKPDIEKTKKLLDQMPLGEMHFREMLG